MNDPRKSDLAKIHIAKQQLRMSDEDYAAAVGKISKGRTRSAGELNVAERGQLLAHFRRCGFKAAPKRKAGQPYSRQPSAATPLARKARAMWLWGADVGLVRDRSERALNHFAASITGASDLAFCDANAQAKVVEAIKAMYLRALPAHCAALYQPIPLMRVPPRLAHELIRAGQIAEATGTYSAWAAYCDRLCEAGRALGQAAQAPKTAQDAKNDCVGVEVPTARATPYLGRIGTH